MSVSTLTNNLPTGKADTMIAEVHGTQIIASKCQTE